MSRSNTGLDTSEPHAVSRDNFRGLEGPHVGSNIDNLLQHSTSLIEVIPQSIDVEEEARLYEELCDVRPSLPSSSLRSHIPLDSY